MAGRRRRGSAGGALTSNQTVAKPGSISDAVARRCVLGKDT